MFYVLMLHLHCHKMHLWHSLDKVKCVQGWNKTTIKSHSYHHFVKQRVSGLFEINGIFGFCIKYKFKPHCDQTLLTSLTMLYCLCFNLWQTHNLQASQYSCWFSVLANEEEVWQNEKISTLFSVWKKQSTLTLTKYSESYKNLLKIVLITSFIFLVCDTHTRI